MKIIRLAAPIRSPELDIFLSSRAGLRDTTLLETFQMIQHLGTLTPRLSQPSFDVYFLTGAGSKNPRHAVLLGYMAFLNSLVGSNAYAQKLLGPFGAYLGFAAVHYAANYGAVPTLDATKIMEDIMTVLGSGSSYKHTQTEEYPMFEELIKQFSDRIAAAATATGNAALASAVKAGNGLVDEEAIYKTIPGGLGKFQNAIVGIVGKLLDEIINSKFDMKYAGTNFQKIRGALMIPFGGLGANTLKQEQELALNKEKEKARRRDLSIVNPKVVKTPPLAPVDETVTLKDEDKQWVSQYFLQGITYFFKTYYDRLAQMDV